MRRTLMAGIPVALLLFVPQLLVPGGVYGVIDDATLWEEALGAAMDMVASWSKNGEPVTPPIDATSLIRLAAEGSISYAGGTRANAPPVNWDLKLTTAHSRIYVGQGESVPQDEIIGLGDIFEVSIYPNATLWFHPVDPPSLIEIRIYDFGDGAGGVGGYFLASPWTLDDVYVDSADLSYSTQWAYEILAHELQHLLHYDIDPNEEVWLNEGLADLSVRVSLGPGTAGVQSHIDTYESLPENDLILWDEGTPPYYLETIADYGRAYTYVSYLAYHFGGREMVNGLVADSANSLNSVDRALARSGYSLDHMDVLAREKVADIIDDASYGGGIFEQGLIDIGITSLRVRTGTYPYQDTITAPSRYSGYYYRFESGGGYLGLIVNSTSPVHVAMVGLYGGEVVWSENLTGDGSGPVMYQLLGFGELYDTLFAVPSTDSSDAPIVLEVKATDLTPPVTVVTVAPAEPDGGNGYYLDPPDVTLTTNPGSTVQYSWNGEAYQAVETIIVPPEGENTLSFYARNVYGLTEPVRTLTFKVDTIDPVTDIVVDPAQPDGDNGYYYTQPKVYLTPQYSPDTIYYDIGEGTFEYSGPIDIPEGEITLLFWSTDIAGRMEEARSRAFKVDLSDIAVTYSIAPDAPDGLGGFYVTHPTVTLSASPAHSIWYSVNGGDFVAYAGPVQMGEGEIRLLFYAESEAGKRSQVQEEFVKVDTVAPSVDPDLDPPLEDGWTSEHVQLTLSSDDPEASILFRIGEDDTISYFSPVLLGDGEYPLVYWAVDTAGNTAEGGTVEVMIDTQPPTTAVEFDREPDNGAWFYGNAPAISFIFMGDPLSDEEAFFSVEGSEFQLFTGQGLELGIGLNTIQYYGIDGAGNKERTKTYDIGFDGEPPKGVLKVNRTVVVNSGPVRFDMSGSTDDNSVYRYKLDYGDGTDSGWLYRSKVTHNYTSYGKFTVKLTVEDISGRTNAEEVKVVIEVLTQEEADRRMRDDEGVPVWVLLLIIVVLVLFILGISIFLLSRLGTKEEVEVEWEMEPPDLQ